MSFNGSGSFLINTAGQPVVSGTVISSTAFNALTADLATGLSTCITKDGQTTVTANIPMANYKFTGLGAGSGAADSANLSQVQSTVVKLLASVSGTDTITAVGSPTVSAYAAGQMFYFVAAGDNTGAVTINIDSLGAKAVTRDGSVALVAGDIKSGEVVVIVYDGTRFQVVSQLNSSGDARFANVSIASALNVGGVATFSAGTAAAPAITTTGDTNTGIFFPAADTIAFAEGGVQAMTLDANGVLLRGNTTARSTNAFGTGQMQVEAASYSAFQMFANTNTVDGSYLGLWKSRGSAVGGTTIVQNGDLCGAVYFGGYDGTNAIPLAAVEGVVDGTPGTNDMPGRIVFKTTSDGASSMTERARIDSSGNFSLSTNGTSVQWINSGNNVAINATSGVMSFYTGTSAYTERARIKSNGYSMFSNNGAYADSTFHEFSQNGGNWILYLRNTSSTGTLGVPIIYSNAAPNNAANEFLYCADSTAERASIRSNGGLANYSANNVNLSDQRVKKNVKPLGSMWDKFKAIEIVTFKYKDQTHDDDNIGVIAQQVESVAPEFIDVDGFGETPEDGVPLKTVYTTDMYHAAIKALQEAMARIEQLEAKVAALEAK